MNFLESARFNEQSFATRRGVMNRGCGISNKFRREHKWNGLPISQILETAALHVERNIDQVIRGIGTIGVVC